MFCNATPGDEILAVNGESLVGLSHAEAIAVFKRIKAGDVVLTVVRRSAKYVQHMPVFNQQFSAQ